MKTHTSKFRKHLSVIALAACVATSAARADYIQTLSFSNSVFLGSLAVPGELTGILTSVKVEITSFTGTGGLASDLGVLIFSDFTPLGMQNGYQLGSSRAVVGIPPDWLSKIDYPNHSGEAGAFTDTFDMTPYNLDASLFNFFYVFPEPYPGSGTAIITLGGVSFAGTSVPDGGSTMALMGLGLLGLGAWRRRQA